MNVLKKLEIGPCFLVKLDFIALHPTKSVIINVKSTDKRHLKLSVEGKYLSTVQSQLMTECDII